MAITLVSISRFPVKGLPEDKLDTVRLQPGRGIPHDREFALALSGTAFDEENPSPLPKSKFAVLARYERLAELSAGYRESDRTISISTHGHALASASLDDRAGRDSLSRAMTGFMGDRLEGPLHLVKGNGHRFTDVSVHSAEFMEAVSIINLASVRDFESKLGRKVDPRRFRGNLLIDGAPAWAEFDWIDREFSIGDVRVKGLKRTRRCPATEVNPDTADRDIRLPLELKDHYGHSDMGIYVSILSGGAIKQGDAITIASS